MALVTTETELCNMALAHIGQAKTITDLDTDESKEANACRIFFDTSKDEILSEYNWPFATKYATLALVAEDPNIEWAFSYRYPTDCVNIRKILSGVRNDFRDSRVPYKLDNDNSGRLILTDMEDAQMEYTERISDFTMMPSDFILAWSYKLAAHICPLVTAGDPYKIQEKVMQMYYLKLEEARSRNANELQDERVPESEFIIVRD